LWTYQSFFDIPTDTDGALYGALIVYAPGALAESGPHSPRANNVDREYVISFNTIFEGSLEAAFESEEIAALASVRHAINGYSFCNLPGNHLWLIPSARCSSTCRVGRS
jgi:hypothetical protein